MVWLALVSIVCCVTALVAQREHYKHQDIKIENNALTSLDRDIRATRGEVDEIKSKVDKLAIKVGFR